MSPPRRRPFRSPRLPAAALAALLLAAPPLAVPARAQEPELASLVADTLRLEAGQVLVAEGHVEMLFRDYRLTATRLVYDGLTDRVSVEGPLVLTQGNGAKEIVLADAAELNSDLHDGVIRSARLVLDRQLQIAANEIHRSQGRYTLMTRAVASSCEVCPGGRTVPLWEIRAARVTHDEEEHQLYFDRAQFRLAGVPIAYIPRLRVPDPSVQRYTGFLLPAFSSSSNLGSGFTVPWFWAIGESRDLTVSPFLSTEGAELLELRYRSAFDRGWMELTGAVSRDHLSDDQVRLYVFGEGLVALPRDVTLTFGLQVTNDTDYLADYDISDDDRLASYLQLERARRDEYLYADLTRFQTLREGEDQKTIASLSFDGIAIRRLRPGGAIGGLLTWGVEGHAHRRRSHDDVDGPDDDAIADGRDLQRLTARANWQRDWLLGGGLVAGVEGDLRADSWWVQEDASAEPHLGRVVPTVAASLRWPFVRTSGAGAQEIIDPMVQVVWSPKGRGSPLNEDSALVEFDEASLFDLSRFPGADAYEQGLRVNLGTTWTRVDPAGWTLGLTLGRVLRSSDPEQFAESSGLGGTRSDWLAAATLDWDRGVSVTNRALFSDDFSFSREELRVEWIRGRFDVGSSYIWMERDIAEERPKATSEWLVDASVDLTDRWTATTLWRYDFTARRGVRTDLGFVWRNECVAVDVSVSHRIRDWENDERTTRFNLSVELVGFGRNAERPAPRRQCTG